MRILKISDVFFPRVNGVSTSIATTLDELTGLGHDVHLIAPAYGEDPPRPHIHRLPGLRVPFDPEDRWMSARRGRALADYLAQRHFDVIHVHTPFVAHRLGVELGQKLQLPVVETYHTFFEEYLHHYLPLAPRGFCQRLARSWSRRLCDQVDAVIVPSTAMAAALEDYGVTAPLARIPTGLRPEDLTGGDGVRFRDRYRISSNRPVLLFVGRLAYEKNIEFLLRMARRVVDRVPGVLLVIAGEGPASSSLRRLAGKLGLDRSVLMLGYLDRENELLDCYRAADLFVFASRTETQGLVLLEAMALGLPVVSTAEMGTRDVLGPRIGCAVVEEDEEAFARQVVTLLSDPERRYHLQREARRYALGQWSAPEMARRLTKLYRSVAETSEMRSRKAA